MKKLILSLAVCVMVFTSCRKERYGDVKFWITPNTAQLASQDGITGSSFLVLIDEVTMDDEPFYFSDISTSATPITCSLGGTEDSLGVSTPLKYRLDLDKKKERSFGYKVIISNTGRVIWSGTIDLVHEKCVAKELSY